jgi:hypothetical protein
MTTARSFYVLLLLTAIAACAQPTARVEASPADLIRRAVQNEIQATAPNAPKYRFQSRKQKAQGSQTKLFVQTQQGMAGMIIAYNDQPPTPEQRRAEEERIDRFVKDPSELQKKRDTEQAEAARMLQIIKALPDAFLYEADGAETGRPGVGKPGEELRRLKFRPNPKYDPPSRVEQVLVGMQGYVLVDPRHERLARIDGTLFKDVGFGWGILGHLDRGGHIEIEQGEVEGGAWRITRINLNFTGKLLLFKNIAAQHTEVFSAFHPVADNLTFAQGLEILKREAAQITQAGGMQK